MARAGMVDSLPSTFQFMRTPVYGVERAGKRPAAPRIHNYNCSTCHVACCYVHCGVLCGTESLPAHPFRTR